jgi:hypothetical protein
VRLSAWLLVACVVLAYGVARAADQETLARAHYTLGLAYYDEGKYADAVAEFDAWAWCFDNLFKGRTFTQSGTVGTAGCPFDGTGYRPWN